MTTGTTVADTTGSMDVVDKHKPHEYDLDFDDGYTSLLEKAGAAIIFICVILSTISEVIQAWQIIK